MRRLFRWTSIIQWLEMICFSKERYQKYVKPPKKSLLMAMFMAKAEAAVVAVVKVMDHAVMDHVMIKEVVMTTPKVVAVAVVVAVDKKL